MATDSNTIQGTCIHAHNLHCFVIVCPCFAPKLQGWRHLVYFDHCLAVYCSVWHKQAVLLENGCLCGAKDTALSSIMQLWVCNNIHSRPECGSTFGTAPNIHMLLALDSHLTDLALFLVHLLVLFSNVWVNIFSHLDTCLPCSIAHQTLGALAAAQHSSLHTHARVMLCMLCYVELAF